MSQRVLDFRSDTVTRPDAEMRRAMAEAEVGDDVYGEDPTVRRLEEEGAEAVGKEAGLFVPSGTMGNQISLHLHGFSGGEVICDALSHTVLYEVGGMAAISGLLPKPLSSTSADPAQLGLLDPAAVEAAIAPDLSYRSQTALISVENSHNFAGGTVYERAHLAALVAIARRHGLPIHLDGARLFNAALAVGETAAALAEGFDTVTFCLSKGLGAPVGSLVCGSRELMYRARRVRKMLGGGMRQVGVIAAAGLVALRKGPARLAEDHENAQRLARVLAEVPGLDLDPKAVRTNIVIATVRPEACRREVAGGKTAEPFLARLREVGILGSSVADNRARLITHRDVPTPDVDEAIERIRQLSSRER
jgi:threonine aldolase